ncbi:MAG: DUF5076 domain-containing protein [Sedimentisphaerales bacterium]|nr:DUF5076 domain-containing protein [Sedimentisphaerales bacterium]
MFSRRKRHDALPPPPLADADPEAVEVLRVWATPGKAQEVVLRPTWQDAGAWGLLLVDVARHAALAYQKEGRNAGEVLQRIREFFDAEWARPTDDPKDISDQHGTIP